MIALPTNEEWEIDGDFIKNNGCIFTTGANLTAISEKS